MGNVQVVWDLPDEPGSNYRRIIENRGFTVEEIEAVFRDPDSENSTPNDYPVVFGETPSGKYILIPYEVLATRPLTVYPITAYEVAPP